MYRYQNSMFIRLGSKDLKHMILIQAPNRFLCSWHSVTPEEVELADETAKAGYTLDLTNRHTRRQLRAKKRCLQYGMLTRKTVLNRTTKTCAYTFSEGLVLNFRVSPSNASCKTLGNLVVVSLPHGNTNWNMSDRVWFPGSYVNFAGCKGNASFPGSPAFPIN